MIRRRLRNEVPDCRSCGLCCISGSEEDTYCDLDEDDLLRLETARGRRWVRRHVEERSIRTTEREVRSGPLRGWTATVCSALRGVPMRRVSCSVYDDRPQACRQAVVPGDRECLGALETYRRMLGDED